MLGKVHAPPARRKPARGVQVYPIVHPVGAHIPPASQECLLACILSSVQSDFTVSDADFKFTEIYYQVKLELRCLTA